MRADGRAIKQMREQDALVDFDAVLVALGEGAFALHLIARGYETRYFARRGVDKVGDAHERGEVLGERAIERLGVGREEDVA